MIPEIAQRREEVRALCRRFGVRRLDLFGSAARDDFGSTIGRDEGGGAPVRRDR